MSYGLKRIGSQKEEQTQKRSTPIDSSLGDAHPLIALRLGFENRMCFRKRSSIVLILFVWNEDLPWLKLSRSTFSSSLSSNLSKRGELPPFIERKYWLHRVRPASFFSRFSFARLWIEEINRWARDLCDFFPSIFWGRRHIKIDNYLFWNHTCTTRISKPVSCDSCSRTCRAGFGLLLYAVFKVSNCLAVIVVRGLLFGWSPSNEPSMYKPNHKTIK